MCQIKSNLRNIVKKRTNQGILCIPTSLNLFFHSGEDSDCNKGDKKSMFYTWKFLRQDPLRLLFKIKIIIQILFG